MFVGEVKCLGADEFFGRKFISRQICQRTIKKKKKKD